eukprot:TRINITY_DN5278_c0_g1_i2.p1 TRINITY_DN5278_c0_g1~~TRINITY_DN5278_c0_g1_i2.p1  ORF type:complete len:263 (+),score=70.98 TRINITY_DN5278_c0_g1_i2:229-1017(+)
MIGFYFEFIDCLFKKLNGNFSIYGVGHAGHGVPGGNGDKIFTLEEQIRHKERFVEERIAPNHDKIILVSHSVGSYICLKLIKRRKDLGFVQLVALFPTFRHLKMGIQGPVKFAILPYLRQTASAAVHYIPQFLINWAFKMNRDGSVESVQKVLNTNRDYYVVMNCLSMAHEESETILEMDEEIAGSIEENIDIIFFLYGPTDKYAPRSFYDHLKEKFPAANAFLAEENILHAFCVKQSKEVAHQIYEWFHRHHIPLPNEESK